MQVLTVKRQQRVIANISLVDYFGTEQEFANVDITDHDTLWVATDTDGCVFIYDDKPVLDGKYWDHPIAGEVYHLDTGIEFLIQESETGMDQNPKVDYKDSLVEIKVG
jgi:hypothetical protein